MPPAGHHQNPSLPQFEKSSPVAALPPEIFALPGTFWTLSRPLISTVLVEGIFPSGCEAGFDCRGSAIVVVNASFAFGGESVSDPSPVPGPACGASELSAAVVSGGVTEDGGVAG